MKLSCTEKREGRDSVCEWVIADELLLPLHLLESKMEVDKRISLSLNYANAHWERNAKISAQAKPRSNRCHWSHSVPTGLSPTVINRINASSRQCYGLKDKFSIPTLERFNLNPVIDHSNIVSSPEY